MSITDQQLMAYIDGALAPDEAATVEQALAVDEDLAAKAAAFADSAALAKRALGTAPPVPDSLAAAIRAMAEADAARRQALAAPTAQVFDLAARRKTVPFWQLPLAASIALTVGVFGGWLGKPQGEAASGLAIAAIDEAALVEALTTVKSGERADIGGGAEFAAITTFRDGNGQLCREFEHDQAEGGTVVAVACKDDATWAIRLAVAAVATDAVGYAPASSLDTLDAWLSATEAGAPLSDDEEAAALAALR
jgi:anti-sigma factor RsiW